MKTFERSRFSTAFLSFAFGLLSLASSFGQQPAAPTADGNAGETDEARRNRRANLTPDEMRKRMSAALKEQFQVESDEEWALIGERILKVMEIRRASGTGIGAGMMGRFAQGGNGGGGGGGDNGGNRGRMGGFGGTPSPEADALSAALKNNAPAAELKARLDRLRESRKANEAKLAVAQEDLRAVLNVRQEALAVMMGMLP